MAFLSIEASRLPSSLNFPIRLLDFKRDRKDLLLLAELSHQAAIIGQMGYRYTKQYLHNGEYREALETGLQWVIRCMHGSTKVLL